MTALATAPLSKAKRGIAVEPPRLKRRWGTTVFMVVIHAFALVALLPRFWSGEAIATLLVLYWLTACIDHRLPIERKAEA